MGFSGVLLGLVLTQGGCTKDTDCKGERVCEAGVCVSPPGPAAPPAAAAPPLLSPPPPVPPADAPPPAPPPPAASTRTPLPVPVRARAAEADEYPRVVRRGALTCVQSLTEGGELEESCRDAPAPSARAGSRRRLRESEPPEPAGRFAFDFHFRGGGLFGVAGGTSIVLPTLSATLGLGGAFRSGVGVLGLVNVDLSPATRFGMLVATLAPALRLGKASHVTLSVGPSLLSFWSVLGGGTGFAFTSLVQGVIQLAGNFSLALSGGATFDASGVLFVLGLGLGFSGP